MSIKFLIHHLKAVYWMLNIPWLEMVTDDMDTGSPSPSNQYIVIIISFKEFDCSRFNSVTPRQTQ